jgi:hypothetical protein
MNLTVRYGDDSLTILEMYNNGRYEVAHWTEDEIDADPAVAQLADNAAQMAQENPRKLIKRLYGSVEAWERERRNRRWD